MKNHYAFLKKACALSFACLFAWAPAMPALGFSQNSVKGNRVFAITNVRIFDGDQVIERGTVVVKDGKISAVGKKIRIPKAAARVDGAGKTLLPGFIDGHVHMADSYAAVQSLGLEQAAVYGVTTVLDMGVADPVEYQEFKKRVKAGAFPQGADLFTAGVAATAPGGHGDFRKKNPTITSSLQVTDWVSDRVNTGSDYIKIMSETFEEHNRKVPTLSYGIIDTLVVEAHKHGLLAVSHTLQESRARRVIEAGIDGLVHISPYDAPSLDFGKFAAAHHIFQSTNLISYAPVSYKATLATDKNLSLFMPLFMIDQLKNASLFPDSHHEYSIAAFKQLKEAGVPIIAGTDIGYPYAPLLHSELEIMVKDGGMTPLEALKTATSNTAKAYRLKDRGNIRAGLRADLLLVDGDPIRDILATRRIVSVWKEGIKIDREAYQAKLPAMKAPPPMGPPPPKK